MIASSLAPDHEHRARRRRRGRATRAWRPSGEQLVAQRLQRRLHAVEPLVLQHVVDHRAVDQRRVGEQPLQHRLEVAPPGRRDEAVDVLARRSPRPAPRARSASATAPARARRPRTRPPPGRPSSARRGARARCPWPSRNDAQRAPTRSPRLLDRAAVAREVERVDGPLRRQRLGVEQPVVEVAAEAVQEHERLAALALRAGSADPVRRPRGSGPASSSASPGTKRGLELGHERVDLGVGHRRVGDHAEQPADRR